MMKPLICADKLIGDSDKQKREQHPLWMLLPAVLFKIALNYETSMALISFYEILSAILRPASRAFCKSFSQCASL